MRIGAVLFILALPLASACGGPYRPVWHDQKLRSGASVKVTSFNLVSGVEHDDRDPAKDCFALEYMWANSAADVAQREAEAADVFELVRPASEQWGFRMATVAGFPTVDRRGRYDQYVFTRQADGRWTFTRTEAKVFAND